MDKPEENVVENPVENALPPQTAQPSSSDGAAGPCDGLSGRIAAEIRPGYGSETGGGSLEGVKKRGRPAIHGRYSQANGSDGRHRVPVDFPPEAAVENGEMFGGNSVESPARGVENGPEPRVVIPADLLTKVIGESLGLLEHFAAVKIRAAAAAAGLSDAEIKPQLDQTALGDRRKALVAELTPLALQEWGMDPQLSPSAALGLLLAPWAFGCFSAYRALVSLAAERAQRQKEP